MVKIYAVCTWNLLGDTYEQPDAIFSTKEKASDYITEMKFDKDCKLIEYVLDEY